MITPCTTTLPNGLRVVTVPQGHLHAAACAVLIGCGSRHDPAEAGGLSHLLEHMVMRGSERLAAPHRLAEVFEQAGGCLEGATWRDHTSFSCTLHPSAVGAALAALGGMLTAPTLAGLAIERGVIAEEMAAELDDVGRDLDLDNVSRAAVWAGHPMGRRIIGSRESLARLDEAALRAHLGRHYVASNAVLCVAGNIDPAAVVRLAGDFFGPMPRGAPGDPPPPAPRFAGHGRHRRAARRGPQVAAQLTFEAVADGHPAFAATALLATVLHDGMASRLWRALCGSGGLVYEVDAGLDCYADCGAFDITLHLDPAHLAAALHATAEVVAELCRVPLGTAELERARARHRHEAEFLQDAPEELALAVGTATLFGRPAPDAEAMAAVDPAELQRAARRLFAGRPPHLTLLGPRRRLPLRPLRDALRPLVAAAGLADGAPGAARPAA